MNTHLTEIQKILGKPYHDLAFLLQCFSEVLHENGENDLAACIPWINKTSPDFKNLRTDKVLHLYSISFQLLNLAEVNGAVQNRRTKVEQLGPESVNGLWTYIFTDFKKKGISEETILHQFKKIAVEPVLTAHPTEAKRPVILGLYRELYLLMVKRENTMYTSLEKEEIKNDIKQILHKLWYIGEIYLEKPAVESELENVLYYFYSVFPNVLHYSDYRLRQAWEKAGYDPEKIKDSDVYPSISFGDWVGGDRDGHPLVTADVTEYTLKTFRLNAFKLINRMLDDLCEKLSIYCDNTCMMPEFISRLNKLSKELGKGEVMGSIEPYKVFVLLLKEKLPIVERTGGGIDLMDGEFKYRNSDELVDDLHLLKEALIHFGAVSLARNDVQKIIRHLKVFGFHLAHLDIRQNSKYYEDVLLEIVQTSLTSLHKELVSDRKKYKFFIEDELKNNRPFVNRIDNLQSGRAKDLIKTYHKLGRHIRNYSEKALGSLIVSMTRNLNDLLTVYLMAREAGLILKSNDKIVCPLPIVPLFETIEDLEKAAPLMDALFKNTLYQRHLASRGDFQEIMLGYSDSNKDGGFWMANWALQKGQERLSEVCLENKRKFRFFHGRGGSVGRGGGRANQAIFAMPIQSRNGRMRFTEQGEVISFRYARPFIARRHLEQIVNAVLQTAYDTECDIGCSPSMQELMERIATASMQAYRQLIDDERLWQWYKQVTPIEHIGNLPIASRPVSRVSAKEVQFDDLRAIPWVFSWTQTRYNLPGWYGAGTALEKEIEKNPETLELLREMWQSWPFFRTVIENVQLELVRTRLEIAQAYSTLSEQQFHDAIASEFEKTKAAVLKITGQERLLDNHMAIQQSIVLRNPYTDVLNLIQIELLKRWNKASEKQSLPLRQALFLSINGIAAAMQSTG